MSNAHSRGNGVNPKAGGWASAGTKTAVAHNIGARKTRQNPSFARAVYQVVDRRNARSVWTIASEPSADPLHFAAFPRELPLRCILAGCPPGGVVMDPFSGTGTTGVAALETGRDRKSVV